MSEKNDKQYNNSEESLERMYQTAIHDLKRAYEHHADRLEDKITAKNSQIAEAAIDKTFKVLYPILALFGAAVVVLSYFGYDDVRSSVINHTTNKVDSWLSYEEYESPLKDSLLDLRDRYLLDSVFIRHQRSKADSNRILDFKLTDKELSNLVRIANNKDTSYKDYSDILNIYASNFYLGPIKFHRDYKGIRFSSIFTDNGFKDQRYKQKEFLKVFSHDYSIYPIAKKVLDENEDYLRYESFNAVANINPPAAIQFSNTHLNAKTFGSIDHEMARLLAKEDPASEKLKRHIKKLYEVRDNLDGWLYQYFDLFSLLNVSDREDHFFTVRNKQSNKIKQKIAEEMLTQIIDDGYQVLIRNDGFAKALVISKPGKQSTFINRSDADGIYKNKRLLNNLTSLKQDDTAWLTKLVSCLEVKADDEYLITLLVELNPDSSIVVSSGEILIRDDILGKVWMTTSEEGKLMASYRGKAGEIHQIKVGEVHNLAKSEFEYRYIEKDLHTFIKE